MSRVSPMMEQYRAIKEQHPDKLLMFQVGDFYELFYEDARTAAREMEIALTSRDAGSEDPIPLAGVPIHAAETYLNRLLAGGHRVVICDQVEEASQAKGLVRREITRILTPGTVTDAELLDESRNNYLLALVDRGDDFFGLAAIDISTGQFMVTEQKGEGAWPIIADELRRLEPSEIVCGSAELENLVEAITGTGRAGLLYRLPTIPDLQESREKLVEQWDESTWRDLDLERYPLAAIAGAMALTYLQLLKQLPEGGNHFHRLELYFPRRNMVIDSITNRNLELTSSLREGGKRGSLLGLLDRCMTAMGRRMLRRCVEQPLLSRAEIEARLTAVEELLTKPLQRRDLRQKLKDIFDLERFCSRLSYGRINARDLAALKNTLRQYAALRKMVAGYEAPLLRHTGEELPSLEDLYSRIDSALVADPPTTLKEGGLFKTGYHEEVDRLKKASTEGKQMLLDFEKNEKERWGIKSLRIGYNRNFGYYIEVTRSNLELVPPEYHRKQTLVNAERFTTEELSRMEEQITGAREKLALLEYSLFEELRDGVSAYSESLLEAASGLALIDILQSLAEAAEKQDYCRPVFSADNKMLVKGARHPVVEQLARERFVPNDITLDQCYYLLVITGPNMAGKSTYIRSAALIAIMAQMGGFVPASSAELPLVDRIFARVGAGDDLSRGHSTFMVEMQETAAILQEATTDSLIILDEIGRGTSTYDGMSIARAVLEYISRNIGAKTLFSTHYHELTRLEGELPGIKNYTIAVKEKGREVIFLRRVVPGRADKSYGVNVARLAGVPLEVLIRAEAILAELELAASTAGEQQLSLLPMISEPVSNYEKELAILARLKEMDVNRITPLEAMQTIFGLQQELLEIDEENEK